jgi:hypothetical protein
MRENVKMYDSANICTMLNLQIYIYIYIELSIIIYSKIKAVTAM